MYKTNVDLSGLVVKAPQHDEEIVSFNLTRAGKHMIEYNVIPGEIIMEFLDYVSSRLFPEDPSSVEFSLGYQDGQIFIYVIIVKPKERFFLRSINIHTGHVSDLPIKRGTIKTKECWEEIVNIFIAEKDED